jgi:hypothetical protein
VRTGGCAAVGVVSELMDMEGTLGICIVARKVPGDGGLRVLIGLLEGHGAGYLGVSSDGCNCRRRS